jgi:Protein of unknown function (DUF616)
MIVLPSGNGGEPSAVTMKSSPLSSDQPQPAAPKICVYTVLTGGYERLNEQPVAAASGLDFLCFTDDPGLRSETWQIRYIRPLLPDDPTRSARVLKIRAHAVLPDHDVSLYIDNSVVLRRTPDEAIVDLLPERVPLALVAHSFRRTVRDEFAAVAELRLEAASRLEEQLAHYESRDPDSLALRPLAGLLLLRRHHDPTVVAAMETWCAHVLRYSRRDQLSLWVALRQTGLEPLVHELDNHESAYHRWPITIDRDRSRGGVPWTVPEDRLEVLEAALAERASQTAELERLVSELRSTRSWRWTAPVRRVRASVRAAEAGKG